jgi:hypothetical protein
VVASGGSTGGGAVTFVGGGTLQLDASVSFGGLVAGFGAPDHLDVRDIAPPSGPQSLDHDLCRRQPVIPEALAQGGFLDLAGGRVGDFVDEHDVVRHPPFGDLVLHEVQNVVLAD